MVLKYSQAYNLFMNLARSLPKPHLSIFPFLHKRNVTEQLIIKPDNWNNQT